MYKVKREKIKFAFTIYLSILLLFLVLNCYFIYDVIVNKDYQVLIILFFTVITFIFCAHKIAVISMKTDNIKYLEKNGKLVKNLNYDIGMYHIVTSAERQDRTFYYAIVKYKLDGENEVELRTESTRFPKDLFYNKYIDLIYDEKDPSNYYLEFDIKEIGGENND